MIKVPVDTLKTGDILGEHILNAERQVLLSAGTVLSRKTITLLKLWEIKEIKLREETDTDDMINFSMEFDEIVHKNSHLFEEKKPVEESITPSEAPKSITPMKWPVVLSSVISEKPLQQYDDMTTKISHFFANIKTVKDVDIITAMSNIICKYAATTPCVMGYTFNRETKNIKHEKLINHSMSVAIISAKIASLLRYPTHQIQQIVLGALLHDIGKTQLLVSSANHTSNMTLEDEKRYQSHVQLGYDLIKSFGLPREITLILVQHHEWNDGSGFPMHLTETKIHPYAQIVALADMFDTLTHENDEIPNLFDIRSKLIQNGANKFNMQMLDIFDHYLSDFIFNINVELTDGRSAEVVYTHPSYMSLVVRTTDGDFVDLSKNKELAIKKSFL